ncbi:MAG: aminotransferase class I/II-fold pyridoxal phosphate-dependent enzyme [Oscillospiraceae bacterium]|nr:aminotransferase class I/II-fold pyridoxal phosphate-dependent enzyme [Oscillospiraceae bacterium]
MAPISRFLEKYAESGILRAHMPGHKGKADPYDITEIKGADSLYEAEGIIAESERRTAALFGSYRSFYSCGGSTLCIQAMLMYLSRIKGKRVLAARNCHRAFLNAAALLDLDVVWLPSGSKGFLSADIDTKELERALKEHRPHFVYLTTPDYPGNILPLDDISETVHRYGALLAADNAHGAYLRFIGKNGIPLHPLFHGADICCDSAHKTLPVLTGGAYLHIGENAKEPYDGCVKQMMSVFGSSSPSYLILRSLDEFAYTDKSVTEAYFSEMHRASESAKDILRRKYRLAGDEPGKISIFAPSAGYTGNELGELLRKRGIECEYSDSIYTVLMITGLDTESIGKIRDILMEIPVKEPFDPLFTGEITRRRRAMSLREAFFAPSETVPIEKAPGRICSRAVTVCPPGVAFVTGGEVFDEKDMIFCRNYGILYANVVK